jgi:hypothetical protein
MPMELKAEGVSGDVPATPTPTPILLPALIVTGTLSPDVADNYIPTSSCYNTDATKEVYWRSAHKHDNGSGVMQYWYMPYDGAYLFIRPVLKSNADMRLNYKDYADGLADVAADKRLGDASDKTYYTDGVHMTDAGYAAVAEIVEAAVKRLVDTKK